jgi:hypothetical protein
VTKILALAALLLAACQPVSHPSGDAGTVTTDAAVPCTVDEECAYLGPYGYCRTWSAGEPGVCTLD